MLPPPSPAGSNLTSNYKLNELRLGDFNCGFQARQFFACFTFHQQGSAGTAQRRGIIRLLDSPVFTHSLY